jgi:hypothetical protein
MFKPTKSPPLVIAFQNLSREAQHFTQDSRKAREAERKWKWDAKVAQKPVQSLSGRILLIFAFEAADVCRFLEPCARTKARDAGRF